MIYSILRFFDLAISNFKVASFSVSLFFFLVCSFVCCFCKDSGKCGGFAAKFVNFC